MRRLRSFATGITFASLIVAFVAIGVIAVGVLVVAQSTFDRLMVQAGASAVDAQAMFDHSVTTIFGAAVLIAVAISVAAAVVLAAWLSRPVREMALAAEGIAAGNYTTRVPGSGPNELASLADSFNRMAKSLAEQEQQRTDFIANAAHELRTPLTNLQGYLEALRDGVIAPTPEQFRSLHEEAERLVRLSRSLEGLAVNQRAEDAVRCENVDVAQAIRSAYEVARPAFEAKAIDVDMTLPDSLLARAEPDGLAQVLANLLQNAWRYTPLGGSAAIRATGHRSRVVVSVSNTGDGIPDADLPHVFERFYRVEKSRDAARGGAGIGLAIVKQLVEASGGRVGADSDGRLTRVWFSLPAA
jgi:two-component system sensor histidine kinase BaeS